MPNQTITVRFTVQNEDDFFGTLEEGMISDQGGYSSYTVLDSSDDRDSSGEDNKIYIARDEYNRPSKSDLSVAYNRILAEKDNECSLFLDDFNPASKEVLDAVNDIVKSIESNANKRIEKIIANGANGVISPAPSWRVLYGEFLENEILSDKLSSLSDILFEIEGSHTPYCVMEFIEGAGWECYQDFMGGEEIYYSSLLDQPE
jgi:hypothetical protein